MTSSLGRCAPWCGLGQVGPSSCSWCPSCSGARPSRPQPLDEVGFRERATTKEDGQVRVTAAVPSPAESAALFGVDVAAKGIQPVWLRIENHDDVDDFFLPISLDPHYFSAQEAAWKSRFLLGSAVNEALAASFEAKHIPVKIKPGEAQEGFVYSNLAPGVKFFEVMLFHPRQIRRFDYFLEVPGLTTDYQHVDFAALHARGVTDVDTVTLGRLLEALPGCVLGPDGATPGDPLNLVVIGERWLALLPFIRRGWHVTETVSGGSVWRTVISSLFKARYRTSPISPLYLFGRRQDIALQKARESVDERNHLRVWLTPWRYNGMEVWVGQISRDIGVRWSSKTFVTHKIDPHVDAARDYLLTDLFFSGRLAAYGHLAGVGAATRTTPRFNYTGDPYHTDGRRVVLVVSTQEVPWHALVEIDWADVKPQPP
jgi:hypothetical protein